MRTLDRYFLSIFIRNLLLALFAMSALFLFQAMFNDLYNRDHEVEHILIYHFMDFPAILVQMCPPAVLLSTVVTLSGLSRTQELVACYAIGVGLNRLMTLALSVILIVASLMLVAQDRILPPLYRTRTIYKQRVIENRPDFFLDVKRDKIWYRSKNMIYNLQRFENETQTIIGMAVYTFDDNFNLIQMIAAEKAKHTDHGWLLLNGTVTVFSKESAFPLTQNFQEKTVLIAETPKDFQEIEKEVDGLRLKELYQYIRRIKNAGADAKSYEVKFHSRISLSFIPFVMCFLAIPFSTGMRREGGLAKDLALCLLLTFFYWLFYSIGLSLGTNGALPPLFAAWMPNIFFIGLAGYLISRKN